MIWKKKKFNQNNLFISIGGGINQIPLIFDIPKDKKFKINIDNTSGDIIDIYTDSIINLDKKILDKGYNNPIV
jgi:hypothetical protein